MHIKLHRLKVGGHGAKAFGYGATWTIGFGILLIASSITIFSEMDAAAFICIMFIPLLAVFYLSTNFRFLRYIIFIFSAVFALGFGVVAIPDFLSNNVQRSGAGLYHGIISIYFIGICITQVFSLKYKTLTSN